MAPSVNKKECRYRKHTLNIANELKQCGARLLVRQLKELIDSSFAPSEHKVTERTYRQYLDNWRREETVDGAPLREALAQVLREEPGRPTEDDLHDLRMKLPEQFARILWPAMPSRKKLQFKSRPEPPRRGISH